MKKIHVSVTQADIDQGLRGSATCCPIARAMCRVPGTHIPVVSQREISFLTKSFLSAHRIHYFDTPPEVQAFISDFDTNRPVAPLDFVLTERV